MGSEERVTRCSFVRSIDQISKLVLTYNRNDSDAKSGNKLARFVKSRGGGNEKRAKLSRHELHLPSTRGVRPGEQLETFGRRGAVRASRSRCDRFPLQRTQ